MLERQYGKDGYDITGAAASATTATVMYRGADKSLALPGRTQPNVSVRMARISFGAMPYRKRNTMTARVAM